MHRHRSNEGKLKYAKDCDFLLLFDTRDQNTRKRFELFSYKYLLVKYIWHDTKKSKIVRILGNFRNKHKDVLWIE